MNYNDFIEAGYRIFGLHSVANGVCGCGDPTCNAAGKHPVASNWQHTPLWSDEQIEVMEMSGQLETGYGVLVSAGLLVVDVDARNGGVEAYQRLVDAMPELSGSGLIVETGSGGGSKHLYFSVPQDAALRQHMDDYKGIDFKSSGFVVGPGSMHASGRRYEIVVGSVGDIAPAPSELVDLLRKPERVRAMVSGSSIDYTVDELRDMVMTIPNTPDTGHETYIRVGMGLHEGTGGTDEGLMMWKVWAEQSARYSKKGGSKI